MRKALLAMSILTLILTTVFIGYVGYYMLWPFKPVVFNFTGLVPVENTTVRYGENLLYKLDYCRNTSTHSHITRQFIDGLIYTSPSIETINPMGCQKITVAVPIPESLPSGKYHLRVLVNTEISKLRTIQNIYETEAFQVIGRDEIHEMEDAAKFEKLLN